jgi:hypothetical protein
MAARLLLLVIVVAGSMAMEEEPAPAPGVEVPGGKIGDGVLDIHGTFIAGSSGADWPHPQPEDLSR